MLAGASAPLGVHTYASRCVHAALSPDDAPEQPLPLALAERAHDDQLGAPHRLEPRLSAEAPLDA
eukprot:scaffold178277_cov24-Tisochrysis_lutea.AAC.3